MSRSDDETEPMTRLLGVIAHAPRADEPPRRLVDVEKTRLEIARPRLASTEPATRIVHPSQIRPALSLETETLLSAPRLLSATRPVGDPHEAVTARRWAHNAHEAVTTPELKPDGLLDDVTVPQPPKTRMAPFMLAALLIAVCLGAGASLMRPKARGDKPVTTTASAEATQTEAIQPTTPTATARDEAATAAPTPTPSPSEQAPAAAPATPVAPVDLAVVAELEKRAVDRLRDNDHPGALSLYRELVSAEAGNRAFPLMVALLERRVGPCQGDPRCAR